MTVGHVWKSSVYIFLLTLFCVIAPWNLDFQSSLNLSFSRSYSLRRLEVQESTAKCLSSCSADGLVRRHTGIHLIKRVRFTRCRVNYYNNCDASFNLEFLSLCGDTDPNPGPTAGKTTSKCSVCGRAVGKNQLAITCDSCCQQTHIKCGGITAKRYKQPLSCSNYCWDCPTCIGNLLQQLPFANVDDIIKQNPAKDNSLQNMSSHGEPTIKFPRKTNKKECTIALLNVNSLPSKFIEIKEWLVDGVFDILCIQETKIDSTFPNSQFHVNGYSILRRDRKKGGGGVMIFVRDSITAMPIKIVCKFVEAILLDLTIGQTRFALIAAYKPPSVNNVPFTSDMYSVLDKATSQRNNIICLGDLNCDISNPLDNNNKGRYLLDICDIYDLDSLNNSPTRISS